MNDFGTNFKMTEFFWNLQKKQVYPKRDDHKHNSVHLVIGLDRCFLLETAAGFLEQIFENGQIDIHFE